MQYSQRSEGSIRTPEVSYRCVSCLMWVLEPQPWSGRAMIVLTVKHLSSPGSIVTILKMSMLRHREQLEVKRKHWP